MTEDTTAVLDVVTLAVAVDEPPCIQSEWINYNVSLGLFLHGSFYLVLYVPCAIVMWRPPLIKEPCYRLMAFMACCDLVALLVNCHAGAFMSFIGTPTCLDRYYWMAKIIGAIGNSAWYIYGAMCCVLGVNRIMAMTNKALCERYFNERVVWRWCYLSAVYGLYCLVVSLTPWASLVYHSKSGLYEFDPKFKGTDKFPWLLWQNTINNCGIATLLTLMYIVVVYKLKQMSSAASQSARESSIAKKERSVTMQSIILCTVTGVCAYSYVLVPRFTSDPIVFTLVGITWQMAHGINSVVYLTLNKTIRNEVLTLLRLKSNVVTPSAVSTTKGTRQK